MTVALGSDYESPNSLAADAKKKAAVKLKLSADEIDQLCLSLLHLSGREKYLTTLSKSFSKTGNVRMAGELKSNAARIEKSRETIARILNLPELETKIKD